MAVIRAGHAATVKAEREAALAAAQPPTSAHQESSPLHHRHRALDLDRPGLDIDVLSAELGGLSEPESTPGGEQHDPPVPCREVRPDVAGLVAARRQLPDASERLALLPSRGGLRRRVSSCPHAAWINQPAQEAAA